MGIEHYREIRLIKRAFMDLVMKCGKRNPYEEFQRGIDFLSNLHSFSGWLSDEEYSKLLADLSWEARIIEFEKSERINGIPGARSKEKLGGYVMMPYDLEMLDDPVVYERVIILLNRFMNEISTIWATEFRAKDLDEILKAASDPMAPPVLMYYDGDITVNISNLIRDLDEYGVDIYYRSFAAGDRFVLKLL